jgi:uncharacterized protein YndB with AHSA1/START domain
MVDINRELIAIHRETGPGKTPVGDGKTVLLRRTYSAEIEDVWDALTSAEWINRWFLPVSGDLRLGGRYQLEGNAGGEVLACVPPTLLRVSWVMGEPDPESFSEVEVRLSRSDAGTVFELEHTATVPPGMWEQFGPGAVGVGWDLTVLGLGLHLESGAGMSTEDKQAWAVSEEARQFMTASSGAWGDAYLASGASPEVVAAAVAATTEFYAPALPPS